MQETASRKVMVSPEVMASWTRYRDWNGSPIELVWGKPDADGWWSPSFRMLPCDHAFLNEGDICAACGARL